MSCINSEDENNNVTQWVIPYFM